MNEIIQKAIEGGYENSWKENANIQIYSGQALSANVEKCILDPLFWQALGKACGWKENKNIYFNEWFINAETFYRINLAKGWGRAVEYLSELVK